MQIGDTISRSKSNETMAHDWHDLATNDTNPRAWGNILMDQCSIQGNTTKFTLASTLCFSETLLNSIPIAFAEENEFYGVSCNNLIRVFHMALISYILPPPVFLLWPALELNNRSHSNQLTHLWLALWSNTLLYQLSDTRTALTSLIKMKVKKKIEEMLKGIKNLQPIIYISAGISRLALGDQK